MDKKALHHLWTHRIRPVKVWYLLVAFALTATVTVVALRANNLHMIKLRDQVYQADKNNGDVEGALQTLRAYVYTHMNTELATSTNVYPPIQLKYTYERLQTAEAARVKAQNDTIYNDAQHYCEQQIPTGFSGRYRISCVEDYVKSHNVVAKNIPDAMYKFDFVSPSWSPDLAGWSLLVTILLGILLVLRIAAGRIIKLMTK